VFYSIIPLCILLSGNGIVHARVCLSPSDIIWCWAVMFVAEKVTVSLVETNSSLSPDLWFWD